MEDITNIRRGLAALLRDVLPANEGQVNAWWHENPSTPCLQIAGVQELEKTSFGPGGLRIVFAVEAVIGLASDVRAQQILDGMLATDQIPTAVESSNTPSGALTSRLQDNGTVLTGQTAAADSVAFLRFLGQAPFQLRNGVEVLLGTFLVEVLA